MLFEMQSKATLIALCKELTRENVNLKSQLERDSDLKNRLTSLEKLTHMGQEFSCKKIFARVIGRHLSPWFESVTLNRGEAQGIKKNAIVLAHFGVVGKVTKVFENFSTVSLTSCPKFRLAVCLDNFSVPMIFSGGGASYVPDATGHYGWKASGTVKNIPMEAEPMLKKS
jgi:rod shape-determining protein MreC